MCQRQSTTSPEAPIIDPVIQKMLDQLGAEDAPPVYTLTPTEARDTLIRIQSRPVPEPDSPSRDLNVEFAGHALRLRINYPLNYPLNAGKRCPAVMYFHGGGWVLGDAKTHDRLLRELAVGAEAAIVFLDYDRAPEHRYPVAIEQAYAATCYVTRAADALGIDANHLAVAGDSAGGNMATVLCLLANERHGPRISGQLLFYPATNANFESGSYRQFSKGPWLTRTAMQWFWNQYVPDPNQRTEATASPLLASKERLAGSPRALIITAENDVLRDEGEAYARRLLSAGVEVVTTRYNGTIHDFAMLNPIADAAPTRAAIAQAIHFLKRVLV
jgi:acetyl esterase